MTKLLIILGILVISPLAYIDGFLIIVLRKKLGRLKFITVLIAYVMYIAMLVSILTADYINLAFFAFLIIAPKFSGLYYLRREFIADIRKLFGTRRSI